MPATWSNAFVLPDFERRRADDEDELGLVVEVGDARRPHDVGVVSREAGVELDETGRLVGHLLDQVGALQLFEVRTIVLADAEELVGVRDRRLPHDLAQVGLRRRPGVGEQRAGPSETVSPAANSSRIDVYGNSSTWPAPITPTRDCMARSGLQR